MEIDTDKMAQLDSNKTFARPLRIDGTDIDVLVMPASFTQFTNVVVMLIEADHIQDIVMETISKPDFGDAEFLAKLIRLLTSIPKLRDRWIDIMQPHCDMDLSRLPVSTFAKVAVTFMMSSIDGLDSEGWAALGKSMTTLGGLINARLGKKNGDSDRAT